MNEKITEAALAELKLAIYPDPHLRETATEILDPTDPGVRTLVEKMFEIMFASRGVGLAGPQVGVTVRLFVASPSFESDDRCVYINPQIISAEGTQDGEEGCLSFPAIYANVKRHNLVTIEATDLEGKRFQETGEELLARIFEHEVDHLEGRLLVDRMGSIAKLINRKALRELESRVG